MRSQTKETLTRDPIAETIEADMENQMKVADRLGAHKTITIQEAQIHKQLDAEQQKNKKEWLNLFSRNNLAARGMNLKFSAPMINEGEKIVELDSEKIDRETAKWKNEFFLYIAGDSHSIGALDRIHCCSMEFHHQNLLP